MKACLFVVTRDCKVQEYEINRKLRIGRRNAGVQPDITIDSPIVSRSHGELEPVASGICFRELGSSNGTYINETLYGKKSGCYEVILKDRDVLRIDNAPDQGRHPKGLVMIFRDQLEASPEWQWIKKGAYNRIFKEYIQASQTPFADMDCVQTEQSIFVNLGDTLLYGSLAKAPVSALPVPKKIVTGPPVPKKPIPAPPVPARQEPAVSPKLEPNSPLYINIVRRTVRQGLAKKRTLLKDIRLTVYPGEMVLILGGSGAGKTTFMNAVMGYEKAEGTIRHGQIDVYTQYELMKYAIGFVPQDVLLREGDTVYDTIYNAAEMKLPSEIPHEALRRRVQEVLEMVSLTHVSSSLIKSISGGEKKRVSAGVELVADPSLFFLDEPDSGLDAQSAVELMENLRSIANAGKIVMIISHSPDRVSYLFDKVIVLGTSQEDNSGRLVFYGSVPETVKFFDTDTLEGVVGRINRRDGSVDRYLEKWESRDPEKRERGE